MDVTFATPGGREFTVEVWYFATVREMKEAVHKREGIPVASQRLFLPTGRRESSSSAGNGDADGQDHQAQDQELELDDARDTAHYGIVQGSRVVLVLPDDNNNAPAPTPPPPSPSASPSPAPTDANAVVRVAVAVPAEIGAAPRGIVALDDVRASDTVARVKELLEARTDGALLAARTALFFNKAEMEDGKALADYGPPAADGGVMDVRAVVRPQEAAPAASVGGGGDGGGGDGDQRERIEVRVVVGETAVAMEVGTMDVVRDLRKEVERRRLPVRDGSGGGAGYFFVYKQNVMDEDRTLRWHDVKNGDTIEILNGTVTGGGGA